MGLLADRPVFASGAVFVDRKNRKNALAAMSEAADNMKSKRVSAISIWIRKVNADFL